MNRPLVSPLVAASILALLLPSTGSAEDRVAQLSKVDGGVTIARAADGKTEEAKMAGARVRNGSVFPRDVVATDANGTAVMLFADGTELQLKPKTKMTVQEIDWTGLVKSGDRAKPVGRKIRILAGDVFSKVVPNPKVATEFETPSGVAAVKGTEVGFSVVPDGPSSVRTEKGEISFENEKLGLSLALAKGFAARFEPGEAGENRLLLPSTNPGPTPVTTASGQAFLASPGSNLRTRLAGWSAELTVTGGELARADGSKIAAGGSIGWASTAFPKTEGVGVSLRTEKGSVEFGSALHQVKMVLNEGNGGELRQAKGGGLKIGVPAGNKEAVPVQFGEKTATAKPGTELSASTSAGGGVNLSVTAGQITTTDANGQQVTVGAGQSTSSGGSGSGEGGTGENSNGNKDEEKKGEEKKSGNPPPSTPQATCSGCSIPDGSGGCRDVDALCPDEPCLKDRKCLRGACTGGRKLTSFEDPNCK